MAKDFELIAINHKPPMCRYQSWGKDQAAEIIYKPAAHATPRPGNGASKLIIFICLLFTPYKAIE